MSHDIEQDVRDLLQDSARRSQVPLPELATIAWAAERETRRAHGRRALVAAAAAVLVGMLTVLPWSFGRDEGMPVRPLPSGPTTEPVAGTPGEVATLRVGTEEVSVRGGRSGDGWTAVVSGSTYDGGPAETLRTVEVPAGSPGTVSAFGLGVDTYLVLAADAEPHDLTFSDGVERADGATVSVPGTPLSVSVTLLATLDPSQPVPTVGWTDPYGGRHQVVAAGAAQLSLPGNGDFTYWLRSLAVRTDEERTRVTAQVPNSDLDRASPLASVVLTLDPDQDSLFVMAPTGDLVYGVTRQRPVDADVVVDDGGGRAIDTTLALQSVQLADDLWMVGTPLPHRFDVLSAPLDGVTWRDSTGRPHRGAIG